MSKIKLLLDAVEDVRALADSLQAIAEFIQLGTASPEETPAQPVDSTPLKHTTPQTFIDQLRTLLAEKSGEGKTQDVKALLYKYDAGKTVWICTACNMKGSCLFKQCGETKEFLI